MTSQDSIEKGDSLAPAVCALSQHDALAAVAADLQAGKRLAAFLDDLYIITTPFRVCGDQTPSPPELNCTLGSQPNWQDRRPQSGGRARSARRLRLGNEVGLGDRRARLSGPQGHVQYVVPRCCNCWAVRGPTPTRIGPQRVTVPSCPLRGLGLFGTVRASPGAYWAAWTAAAP